MKTIEQKHKIDGTPEEVYRALTNPFTIELWSGFRTEMSTEPGSEFSLWEGDIVGRNLEFTENELVKQEWYFEGNEQPSVVTIRLKPKGGKTEVLLEHTNVPDEVFEEMKEGWRDMYWGNIKEFFK